MRVLFLSTKDHALINISEAKEHSTNNGVLCEEKQAIQTSNDISEAHEAFYKSTKDYPPPSPRPMELVAAPSRRTVQQLAAPSQLNEERRTGVVASVHAAASYRVSRFCAQDSHAGGRAIQAATKAG